MDKSTKQIFYLMLGSLCVWLILSEFIGNKHISNAIGSLFPSLLNE